MMDHKVLATVHQPSVEIIYVDEHVEAGQLDAPMSLDSITSFSSLLQSIRRHCHLHYDLCGLSSVLFIDLSTDRLSFISDSFKTKLSFDHTLIMNSFVKGNSVFSEVFTVQAVLLPWLTGTRFFFTIIP